MSVRAVSLRTLSHVSLADAFRSAACYLPNTSAGGGWKPARVPTGSLPPPTFQVRVPPPNARVRVPPSHCGPATHWHRHGCHADDDHPIARKIGVLDGLKLQEGTCFASNLRFYQSKDSFLLPPDLRRKGLRSHRCPRPGFARRQGAKPWRTPPRGPQGKGLRERERQRESNSPCPDELRGIKPWHAERPWGGKEARPQRPRICRGRTARLLSSRFSPADRHAPKMRTL